MVHAVGRLVGRSGELELVERALGDVEAGRATLLHVSGDPGIGKTRLLVELERRAQERGHLVLVGRASELERDLPHAIFVDALDEYLRTVDQGWLTAADRDSDGELARIFPAVSPAPTSRQTVLDERYRVHRAVRTLLEQLAEPRPLVLLLDDLHWADPASVDLVGSLLRRPPHARVLVAFALRRRQAPSRLTTALGASGELVRVELGVLSEPEVADLLAGEVSSEEARRLHEESGGNPFYLEQLVRAPGRRDGPAREARDQGGVALPQTVALALASELADLPGAARSFLDAAAVVGDPFEVDLAGSAAAMTQPEALFALDVLLESGLLQPTDVPRRFRFRHPILRRAVYDATGQAWRHEAHERAARALAARAARLRPRGPTTSSSSRWRATVTRSESSGRRRMRAPSARPRVQRAGTEPRFACCPGTSLTSPSAWRCLEGWRVSPRGSASSRRATRRCSRCWTCSLGTRRQSSCARRRPARGSSICSASTTRRMSDSPRPSRGSTTRSRRTGQR